ncbi:hypothetical protein [Pseudoalteromonas sp. S3173]|uniref:hypothetical protein n=1 Tax=Pseudoalteromonas sp. S3173 TaxID=579531 RepID=UPI00110D0809|nr:hypothetical protein [Pseudoalteromonas sp. S3173]TMS61701.1 hypothetical protein CWC10_10340 [Pseudoalteromonas sp. S3173]|tara:strand:- start:2971 stop:4194 length:1224 start_codon:yes stop_codon:yes gene_type:complete
MDYSKNFLTEEQIDESNILALPLSEIRNQLDLYIHFKGIFENSDGKQLYADGYFTVEEVFSSAYEFSEQEREQELHMAEGDWPNILYVRAVRGTKYSNNSLFVDEVYQLKKDIELTEPLFFYENVIEICKEIGLPTPKPLELVNQKRFNYDPHLINKKSIFTVLEASYIAANIEPPKPHPKYKDMISVPSSDEYKVILESLCDCIKGQHETGFHLITRELWVKSNDEFGEEFSRWYENGTCLKARVDIDLTNTLLSKAELIMWCEFMGIDTGLEVNSKEPSLSVEALEVRINKLNDEVERERDEHQREKELLQKSIDSLNEELLQEKANQQGFSENGSDGLVFPIRTKKLEAALSAQKKFWSDYDKNHPPLQKQIGAYIAEQLGKDKGRDAEELTKAIQPDEVTRCK